LTRARPRLELDSSPLVANNRELAVIFGHSHLTIVIMQISKSQFKARALEYFREVESSGKPIIITDHGNPTLEIRLYSPVEADPKALLKGSVLHYKDPTSPVDDDAWESAQ